MNWIVISLIVITVFWLAAWAIVRVGKQMDDMWDEEYRNWHE